MLSPETKDQLAEALGAVLDQLGDDPDTAELREHLEAATEALGAPEGEAPEGEPEAPAEEEASAEDEPAESEEDEEDAYSFDKAREKFAARRAKKDGGE